MEPLSSVAELCSDLIGWTKYIFSIPSMTAIFHMIIDCEAREIMYLVASVRLSPLSRLNRLTYDLDIWYVG